MIFYLLVFLGRIGEENENWVALVICVLAAFIFVVIWSAVYSKPAMMGGGCLEAQDSLTIVDSNWTCINNSNGQINLQVE